MTDYIGHWGLYLEISAPKSGRSQRIREAVATRLDSALTVCAPLSSAADIRLGLPLPTRRFSGEFSWTYVMEQALHPDPVDAEDDEDAPALKKPSRVLLFSDMDLFSELPAIRAAAQIARVHVFIDERASRLY